VRLAIVNIGSVVTGLHRDKAKSADTILVANEKISRVGTATAKEVEDCDIVIDADGATAIPGLIDSHVHITFGDYTPRQKTVGYLESYTHGGVTTAISASEVHVPGRPHDPGGVKALAIAARKSFEHFRPGGMKVHAGSVILEPGLVDQDFREMAAQGVWLAKAGFGAFATPHEYKALVASAKAVGMVTTMHTGAASIPGSSGIWAEHVLAVEPDVSFHVNGGPVAMPDSDFKRVVQESEVALQLCTAGNLRTALLVTELALAAEGFDRVLIATDTPTGSGIMPLGMLYTISHLCSLGKQIEPEQAIAAATGNNARVFRLNSGVLTADKDADIVLLDACEGGSQDTAFAAFRNGDIAAVGAVITAGVPRFVGKSRNTPPTKKKVRVARSNVVHTFSGDGH
jgi:enamidase